MSSRWFSVLWSVAGEKAENTRQNSVKYQDYHKSRRGVGRIDAGEKKSMDFGGESWRYCEEEHP